MNNTKWREVLICASRLELSFRAAFVGGKVEPLPDEFDLLSLRSPLPVVAFQRDHIGDWNAMCGPYRNLLWVLYPRKFYRVVENSRKIHSTQPIDELAEQIKALGQVPFELNDHYLRVHGYQPKN